MVDPLGGEAGVQGIPVARLIGIDRAAGLDAAGDDGNALVLCADHEGQRPALALAHDDHDAALAGLVLGLATVDAIRLLVLLAYRVAEVGATARLEALGMTA